MVDIAQLVSVPGCGPGGRGFESHYSPHNERHSAKSSYSSILTTTRRIRTGRTANNPVNCLPAPA